MTTWIKGEALGEKHRLHHNALSAGYTAIVDPGDGVSSDSGRIQAAVDSIAATGGVLAFVPSATDYIVNTPIVLPGVPSGMKRMLITGYGARLKTTGTSILTRAIPTDMTDAVNRMNYQFHFEGLNFLGDGDAGQIGIDLYATYGATFRDMWFEDLNEGLRLTFCLMAHVEHCMEKRCFNYGFHARSGNGLWSGAGLANTPSNHTTLKSCRSYGRTGELAQFLIEGSSGIALEDIITEGENPVDAVKIDDQGSTTSKYHQIRNHHSENSPSGAVHRLIVMGNVVDDGLWHQTNSLMIDATDSNNAAIIDVRRLPWTPATPAFKQTAGSPVWVFSYAGASGVDDVTATARWHSAVVPPIHMIGVMPSQQGVEKHSATVRAASFSIPSSGGIGLILEGNAHGAVLYSNALSNYATKWGTSGDDPFGAIRSGVKGDGSHWWNNDTNLYREAADILKTDDRFKAVGGVDTRVVATASLPAAGASMDGHVLIEDNGAGDRNLIIYAGGQRFRIDGGAAF